MPKRAGRLFHPPARVIAALLLLIFAAYFCLTGRADLKHEPWLAKDWTQWAESDCELVLVFSPWVQITRNSGYSLNSNFESASYGADVILRSALPIRQAFLRQIQLDKHYDKMKPQQKQAFDKEHAQDLAASDEIIIDIVNYSIEPPLLESTQTDQVVGPAIPREAALRLPDGSLVPSVRTTKVKLDLPVQIPMQTNTFTNSYEYAFPRSVNGKPMYSPVNFFLGISLGAPLTSDRKTGNLAQKDFVASNGGYTFKISDLMYKGKLEY